MDRTFVYSNEAGSFVIEALPLVLGDDWNRAWVLKRNGKAIAHGRDAQGVLDVLSVSGQADHLVIPWQLGKWMMVRR